MERYVCIHGHFYQPPRENAWLEYVEQQDSAYPFHDWNERITAECYAPNGMSRILDGSGDIERIVNNYSRISFNFGPTLLAWLAENESETYRAVLDADKESQEHFSGHGSAIAQAYNHAILPLCNQRDKYTQILWGIRDFKYRFGRDPEGMWLPETAVDLETLEMLVGFGIRFTILSPFQAKRTRRPRSRAWRDVNGGKVDPTMPYTVRLPSGNKIAVFFYDGPISQAIAFEGLLARGENLAGRLMSAFSEQEGARPQLVHIATDGETYGHHHNRGDMALAYALHHIEANSLAKLTNYGEYLERVRPTSDVEIWERSAWSCSHGIERWNSNCGCNSGGHSDWNQNWRLPLRQSLDWLRDTMAAKFEEKGKEFFKDPWGARNEYINVILDRHPDNRTRFFQEQASRELTDDEKITAFKLLEIQRHTLLMFTSCGWFFDELSGIETTQVIQYAARAIQLHEEVTGEAIEAAFLDRLQEAKSNIAANQDGRVIYEKFVRPAMVDWRKVAGHYALNSLFESYPESTRVYCYTVDRQDLQLSDAGKAGIVAGKAKITSEITLESEVLSFAAVYLGDHTMNAGVRRFQGDEDYGALKQELMEPFGRGDLPEAIRILDRQFGESTFSLRSIFHDDQRRILQTIMRSTLSETEGVYRQVYEAHAPMMRFLIDLRVPLPKVYQAAAEFALNSALRHYFEAPENLDAARIRSMLDEVRSNGIPLDSDTLAFVFRKTIRKMAERFVEKPDDLPLMTELENAVALARELPFEVHLWRTQNIYYSQLQRSFPEYQARAKTGDTAAQEWLDHFVALGRKLSVHVQEAAMEMQQAS